jgi:hypothetical protein
VCTIIKDSVVNRQLSGHGVAARYDRLPRAVEHEELLEASGGTDCNAHAQHPPPRTGGAQLWLELAVANPESRCAAQRAGTLRKFRVASRRLRGCAS